MGGPDDPTAEVERLRAALAAAERNADQWRAVAEERRVQLERVRQHPAMRLLVLLARVVRPVLARVRPVLRAVRATTRSFRRASKVVRLARASLGAGRRERALRRALGELPAPADDERTVSVVVPTRDGGETFLALVDSLTDLPGVEVVVAANAVDAATAEALRSRDVVVSWSEENRTFSRANEDAVALARGELLLFCNDDVEPLDPAWVRRMAAHLTDGVAVVGATLVHPRSSLTRRRHVDLSVQHAGVEFTVRPGATPRARNVRGGTPQVVADAVDVPAVTAAAMLVRAADHRAVGGFDDRYVYGAEDVDLCWRLRGRGRIVLARDVVLLHEEGASRLRDDDAERAARQAANWEAFDARLGAEVRREVTLDRIRARGQLTSQPLHVAITVTRVDPAAGYGDLPTAHGLAAAMERHGWRVTLVERYRDAWYDLPRDVDVVIALLDTFDARRVPEHVTTVAWVRNWSSRWVAAPWFDRFDLVLCSGPRARARVEQRTGRTTPLFPLAVDPARHGPELPPVGGGRSGVLLPINHFGDDRGVPALLQALGDDVVLAGRGWQEVPEVAGWWQGPLDRAALDAALRRARLVVDVGAAHTREDASMNARVLEAIAAGAWVVSDEAEGIAPVLGDLVPTFRGPEELVALRAELEADPAAADARVESARARVLAEHTYDHRVATLVDELAKLVDRPRAVVLIGAPDERTGLGWGDRFYADDLATALARRGWDVSVHARDTWDGPVVRAADVVIQLKGKGPEAPRRDGQVLVLWVISHPRELAPAEARRADVVFVASHRLAHHLAALDIEAHVLHQATDAERFRPVPGAREWAADVAFIGNSRTTYRPVVRAAVEAGLPVRVWGRDWERFLPPGVLAGRFVPNEVLPVAYASVGVLLNDHWDDMREWGIISNRVFDALACGVTIVSDDVPELEDLLPGLVTRWDGVSPLTEVVRSAAAASDETARRARREAVLAGHTFDDRAATIVEHVAPLLQRRRSA
ncbi:MAG: glycosyltransferase [Actinomycetes bacterium]